MSRDRHLDRLASRLDRVRPVVDDEDDLRELDRLTNEELIARTQSTVDRWRADATVAADATTARHLLALADELQTTIDECGPTLRSPLARLMAERPAAARSGGPA